LATGFPTGVLASTASSVEESHREHPAHQFRVQELTQKFVAVPVSLTAELIWMLAKRENISPDKIGGRRWEKVGNQGLFR
jgi:hypothetical protein